MPEIADDLAFERKLYVIRKRAYNEIRTSTLAGAEYWYIVSLSARTIVYKGMLLTTQLDQYFHDLHDPLMETRAGARPFALQHQHVPELGPRASVPLHRPQRRDQHGPRQRELDACPRGAVRVGAVRRDIRKIRPIINPNGSDSGMFDNTLELLYLSGRSLPHAVMMMIPEPWSNHETMDDDKRAFYQYHSQPDGAVGRPGVDRLHGRRCRSARCSIATACARHATT